MTPPSGRQFELRQGDQRAVVVERGGGLRTYSVTGRDVLDGYGVDEQCTGGRGQLLIPWPNRIRDGRYRFAGEEHRLEVTEPDHGNAIHGLVRNLVWTPVEVRPDAISLTADCAGQPGYPFALSLRVDYELGDAGLRSRITARNVGETQCPYGAGIHPYVRVSDSAIDGAFLQVPAELSLVTDDRGIPVGEPRSVEGTALDFRAPTRIGATVLDTGYTALERDREGIARVVLAATEGGPGIAVWMDAGFGFVMIFTGDTLESGRRRQGLAIEPMTCAPDAFNSAFGLLVLRPGDVHSCLWGIDAGYVPESSAASASSTPR